MSEEQLVSPLSDREMEVLRCLATGASNREIAQTLIISHNTVKVHIRNIYEKLGVQSRTEATRRALEEGWVKLDSQPAPEAAADPAAGAAIPAPAQLPRLSGWKRLYLLSAILIAVAVFAIPQLPKAREATIATEPLFGQCSATAELTSEAIDTQRWTPQPDMPAVRSRFALVSYDRKLYAIGGVRLSGTTSLVEIFDPDTSGWQEGTSKPTQAANVKGIALNDRIYVPGGCTDAGQALDTLEVFDPQKNSWSEAAALPEPRCAYALTAREGKLYLLGGFDGADFVDTVFVYDPGSDSWATDAPSLPVRLGFAGAATLNEEIYLAGGYDGNREYDTTYVLAPGATAWEAGPPLNFPRGGLELVETGGTLYAIGGGWTGYLPSNELFRPGSSGWEPFETTRSRWLNLGAAVVDTQIYAVGGSAGRCLSTNQSYKTLFQIFLPR